MRCLRFFLAALSAALSLSAVTDADHYGFALEWSLPIPAQEAAAGISCP